MSTDVDIKVIRRGAPSEIGGNWWKTVLLILAIVVVFFLFRNTAVNGKPDNGNQGSGQPAANGNPSDKPSGRGSDGLFPLSAP